MGGLQNRSGSCRKKKIFPLLQGIEPRSPVIQPANHSLHRLSYLGSQTLFNYIGFEVFTAVVMKSIIF
jgi:hypothetical protein